MKSRYRPAGDESTAPKRCGIRLDIPVAVVGTGFLVVLYLLMMDLVLHNWHRAAWLAAGTATGAAFLYVAWWRRLEPV